MKLKKTLALLLSLVMLFSLAVPALAVEVDPSPEQDASDPTEVDPSDTVGNTGDNGQEENQEGEVVIAESVSEAASNTVASDVAQIGKIKYETLEAAFTAAKDGDTITLLDNCAGNGIVVSQGKFTESGLTVNFDNHIYTVDGNTVGSTGTETNGFQLLKDNKITFKNGAITSAKAKIMVQNYSNLTLDDMDLSMTNVDYNSAYTLSNNNGTVEINNTTITANTGGGFAFDVCRYSSYPSVHVTVKGSSVINGDVEIDAGNGDAKDGMSLTLTSGTLNGDIKLTNGAKAALKSSENASVTKDSDFVQDAPAGYMWDADGKLVEQPDVAEINGTGYKTLEAAFAAAKDGDTITLLADCAGNGIKAPQGKFATGLTIDFDGHTYTVDGATVGSPGTETQAFQLLKDNKITFRNGTIYSEVAKFLVQNYSNLTLAGMTLTINNPGYKYAYTLSNNNGDVVIDSTTINSNPAGGFAFDVCRYSSYPSVHVTVKGSSVINGDIELSASNSSAGQGFSLTLNGGTFNGAITFDAGGQLATVTKAAALTVAVPEDYEWTGEGDTKTLTKKPDVAQIGEIGYNSLAKAIAAAQDGDIIRLLKNTTENVTVNEGQSLVLELNGNTLSGGTVAQKAAITNNGTLAIQDSSSAGTGTVKRDDTSPSGSYYVIDNAGTLTIASGNYTNASGDATTHRGASLIRTNQGGTTNINGGTLTQDSFNVLKDEGNCTTNINGGTITCNNAEYAILTYGALNIKGGSIIGPVDVRGYSDNDGDSCGVATVSGGSITGKIYVEQYTGHHSNGTPSLNITGGTFETDGIFVGEGTKTATFESNDSCGVVTISGGTFTNNNAVYDVSQYVVNGFEQNMTTGTVIAHQHNYTSNGNAANWTWIWNSETKTYDATLRLSCACGASENHAATNVDKSIASNSGTTTTTYTATYETFTGSYVVETQDQYIVTDTGASTEQYTVTGSESGNGPFVYGEAITLKANAACDWTVNGKKVATKTDTYKFIIQNNVTVETSAAAAEEEPVFFHTLVYKGKTAENKYSFRAEVGWTIPNGYSIQSAYYYRLPKASDGTYTLQQVLSGGKKSTITLRNQYVTYGVNMTSATNGYYWGVFVVNYTDASGAAHTYYSTVMSAKCNS